MNSNEAIGKGMKIGGLAMGIGDIFTAAAVGTAMGGTSLGISLLWDVAMYGIGDMIDNHGKKQNYYHNGVMPA